MRLVIDRFEGDFAVVETEDKRFVNMPRVLVPDGAKEGSVINVDLEVTETSDRQQRISIMMNSLWKD